MVEVLEVVETYPVLHAVVGGGGGGGGRVGPVVLVVSWGEVVTHHLDPPGWWWSVCHGLLSSLVSTVISCNDDKYHSRSRQ